MSAALQLPFSREADLPSPDWDSEREKWAPASVGHRQTRSAKSQPLPPVSLAFYRRHTESLLRRYLYASMQVGRAPSILRDPIARGWASSRPIRTFEDAVIFVLDVEKCLSLLGSLDRELLSRIVLQEYTQAEAAPLLGMSVRAISYKFPLALDRLTQKLLKAHLLILPHEDGF
jgi:hypothetical protein